VGKAVRLRKVRGGMANRVGVIPFGMLIATQDTEKQINLRVLGDNKRDTVSLGAIKRLIWFLSPVASFYDVFVSFLGDVSFFAHGALS